ncbi:hypothetical protein [Gemella cuniculi]|nr:hypothetical protein [Gemella cuniculi]
MPTVCFGVVVASGVDNKKVYSKITELLDNNIKEATNRFNEKK